MGNAKNLLLLIIAEAPGSCLYILACKACGASLRCMTLQKFARATLHALPHALGARAGKFYELYADDAQIGHDVLNWKLTVTGARM